MATIRIGLISDTHGLLRPEAMQALQGVDRIIHAGDIGNSHILDQLNDIAPVIAVRGNNDHGTWADAVRNEETFEAGSAILHVLHDVKELTLDLKSAGIDVVIAGHSHRPSITTQDDVLYVNPGSAGPRRFKLPISLAFLEITEGNVKAVIEVLNL